jgi:hypothetical protein
LRRNILKNIFLVFVFSSLLFPQQLKSSPDTLKKLEKVVQENTNTDTAVSVKPTRIEIVNIPEDTLWDDIKPMLGIIIGVIIGWGLSYLSQRKLINKQLNFSKNENWLKEFISTVSEFTTSSYMFRTQLALVYKRTKEENKKAVLLSLENYLELANDVILKMDKFLFFLDKENESENTLRKSIKSYAGFIAKLKIGADIDSIEKECTRLEKEIDESSSLIIHNKRNELKK